MPEILHQLWHFDQHLGSLLAAYGAWVYALIFTLIFLELGVLPLFFLPGNPFVFVCGAFCAQGVLNLGAVGAALWLAMVTGSLLNYVTGRALANGLDHWHWRWPDRAMLARTHDFYEAHGGLTFVFSPYLAVIRTCAPFVGGVAQMSPLRFLLCVSLGAVLWVVPLLAAGYVFGNLPGVQAHFAALVWGGIALGLGALGLAAAWRTRGRARSRPRL
ncbi:MAG: VTT domain-containing protein [Betaproteobacteria bacterium]|nr:VTT domain-containing protein [Betaproteobacteria bacterium]